MRKVFTKTALLLALTAAFQFSFAQKEKDYAKQVIIVNGGSYGSPGNMVTFASYDPTTRNYMEFDSVPGNFTNDALIEGNIAYLTADSFIFKFDISSYQKLDSVSVPGVQKMAIYNDQLVVTRGYGATSNYVQVFDKNDLSLLYSVPEVSTEASGIAIANDTAYIGVPGTWMDTVGKIAVIDLQNQSFVREMNLDTLGAGISDMYASGSKIYTVNTIGWGSNYGSVTVYNIPTASWINVKINENLSGGVALENDTLYMMMAGGIGAFNVNNYTVTDTSIFSGSFASAAFDRAGREFYAMETDYFSFGKGYRYDNNGSLLDTFAVGISPQAIAIQYATNYAPVAQNDTVTIKKGENIEIDVMANDADPDTNSMQVAVAEMPLNGFAYDVFGFKIYYEPDAGFTGTDKFTYALCDTGTAALCDTATVVVFVEQETDISEKNASLVNVYPNPATDVLFIEGNRIEAIQVADIKGKTILNKAGVKTNKMTVATADWAKGVYFLKIRTSEGVVNTKFVKQ